MNLIYIKIFMIKAIIAAGIFAALAAIVFKSDDFGAIFLKRGRLAIEGVPL